MKKLVSLVCVLVLALPLLCACDDGKDCGSCNGTGKCNLCGGDRVADLKMTDGTVLKEECICPDGKCSFCNGTGKIK